MSGVRTDAEGPAAPRATPVGELPPLVALTVVYLLAAKLGLTLALEHPNTSPVWPPSGVAIAALLLFGSRLWPAIFAGAYLANVTTAGSVATSLGIAAGNTLEALLGAALVNRFAAGQRAFQRPVTILLFAVFAGALGPTVAATVGVTSLALGGYAEWAAFGSLWRTWWLGDAGGVLVIAPFLILWAARPRPGWSRRQWLELALLVVALLLPAGAAFGIPYHLPSGTVPMAYVFFPFLAWAAFRFDARATATAALAVSGLALAATLSGHGQFAASSQSLTGSLLHLQIFVAVTTTTSLALAAAVEERRRAQAEVMAARSELESRVSLRTAELGESEAMLRQAEALAHLGSWSWDVAGDRITGSEELFRILGTDASTLDRQAFLALVHPEDRERVSAALHAAAREQRALDLEHRLVGPSGPVRTVHLRGQPLDGGTRLLGTCQDVTEREEQEAGKRLLVEERARRAEAEAAAARAKLLADSSSLLQASLDVEPALATLAARLVPELADACAVHLYEPDGTLRRIASAAEGALSQRLEELAGPSTADAPPLHQVPLVLRGTPLGVLTLANAPGRALSPEAAATAAELGRLAALAVENARLYRQAQDAVKAREEFLSVASHELRTPLTSLLLHVHIAELSMNRADVACPDEQALKSLAVLRESSHRLVRLVNGLLDVTRIAAGRFEIHREELDLREPLRSGIDQLRAELARKRIELMLDAPGEVHGRWDRLRIEEVAANLIGNAMKFGRGRPIHVAALASGRTAVLTVRDQGEGIDPELLLRLFRRFERGTSGEHHGGLGLGLYITRQIVEAHGGTIDVESAPGEGSTFTVRLPVDAPEGAGGNPEGVAPLLPEGAGSTQAS